MPGNPDPLRFVAPGAARAGAGPAVTDHRGQDQVVVVQVLYAGSGDLVAGGPGPHIDDLIQR